MRNCEMCRTKTYFRVPHGGSKWDAELYIEKLLLVVNRVEWMKGICHIWSRGRLISPSMPVGDDWYLNLSSQMRSPGRNLGEHRSVRRPGTASSGTVVLVFYLRMRSFLELKFLPYSMEKHIHIGSIKCQPLLSNIY